MMETKIKQVTETSLTGYTVLIAFCAGVGLVAGFMQWIA